MSTEQPTSTEAHLQNTVSRENRHAPNHSPGLYPPLRYFPFTCTDEALLSK